MRAQTMSDPPPSTSADATRLQRTGEAHTPVPHQLLRAHLRTDAAVREAAVARLTLTVSVVAVALAVLAQWRAGLRAPPVALGALALLALYAAGLLFALRRGWYRPWVAWLDTALEAVVPAVVLGAQVAVHGAAFAAFAPILTLWNALLVLSALRARPALSVFAGALAAAGYALVFVITHAAWHAPIDRVERVHAIARGASLLFGGGAAALIARHFVRRATEALTLVRSRELMNRYFLRERLGAGGMAEVWRATYSPEGGFEKTVALKRVRGDLSADARFTQLFREEARLGAMLVHPNVVQVHDVGMHEGRYMLAMEHVDGVSLAALLRAQPEGLPLAAASYLAAEVAAALDFIHGKEGSDGRPLNLVHCDLNPPNILVSRIGEVKLGDFGVARAAIRASGVSESEFSGKVRYAAPEHLVGGASFDGRADLYALGLTLHECLTGQPVYGSAGAASTARNAAPRRVEPPSRARPGVPAELDSLVMALVERDPERRPPSGEAVRRALLALEGEAAPYPHGRELLAAQVRRACDANVRGAQPAGSIERAAHGDADTLPASSRARALP